MTYWSEHYVGRRYIEGEFDCGDLARLVEREVFGRAIRLPANRRYAGLSGPEKVKAMAQQIEDEKADCATPTTTPTEGDAVQLISRGALCHIGIYCVIMGEPWVLHAASGARQVVLHRIRELHLQGLKVEGYYKWL